MAKYSLDNLNGEVKMNVALMLPTPLPRLRTPIWWLFLCLVPYRSVAAGADPSAVVEGLNREATANDIKGLRIYSRHLIDLLVLDNPRTAYVAALSDRLAMAESATRRGERSLISEADIARSFNDLMVRVDAPSTLRTDVAMVRKFREGPLARSPVPALISIDRNGTSCNPGEAVFILFLLLFNNGCFDGKLPEGLGPKDLPRLVAVAHPPAELRAMGLVSQYSSRHTRTEIIELFDEVARNLGF